MGKDKDSLINKAEATHASKAKKGTHSPLRSLLGWIFCDLVTGTEET